MPDPRRIKIKELILKSKTKCIKCGCTDKSILTFHHREDEIKLFDLANGPRSTIGAVRREIAKCDIMCRPCHDILHDMIPKLKGVPKVKKKPKSGAQRRRIRKEKHGSRKNSVASTTEG